MPNFTAPDGTGLTYHVTGEGPPLLCVPGGPMRASEYLGDLGGLSAHRQLVLLDLRGTGDSAVPADPATYRCDRQTGDIEALREHLGLDTFDLLAHSAGANLAVRYVAGHPRRVSSLVLVTPSARAVGIEYTEQHRREAAALRKDEPYAGPMMAALESIFAGKETDADWDAAAPLYYGRWDAAAQAHAAADVRQTNAGASEIYISEGAFDPAATRAALGAFDAPVLVLAGERDSGPLPRIAGEIAALFPRAEVAVLPGGGHFPWLDDAGCFVRTVSAFL
ncbi:alpha/beta hydrolase [Streptomyces sp. H10-C2]|uniref:alpha/beta fold hydrolase n=1 Tax=unclassified Streptomyces TaxID=2593676 RepID=UPI0024BAD64A|nr:MULTISPECIES: alpha/beta hydrolase [unclassified Streptomyces]MDJ0346034.1 alpha/beta hydrolase [Streptomyces sp. PH10-H1]MDJ0372962.1 alpha/beta hydrolase [Streptomyces sp. H10-C2]